MGGLLELQMPGSSMGRSFSRLQTVAHAAHKHAMLGFLAYLDGCSVHSQHGNKVAQSVPDAHKGFDHIRIKLAASTFYYFTAGLVKAFGLAVGT